MKYSCLVSIIMPSWNCDRFVEESILSILAQTYTNWELLFQDDCSTDETRGIVLEYASRDARIKYECNSENSGAAITRNNAIKRAKGRWIAFLDSDDLWLPNKLEKQVRFMQENNYAFTYTEYQEINEQSEFLGIKVSGPKKITKLGMYAYCWPGCLTVMYDANIVGLLEIVDIKKNNDYAMWLQIITKADCYLLPEVLAQYRKREGSISSHSYFKLVKWHYRLFREADNKNPFVAVLLTCFNLFFGLLKKCVYVNKG